MQPCDLQTQQRKPDRVCISKQNHRDAKLSGQELDSSNISYLPAWRRALACWANESRLHRSVDPKYQKHDKAAKADILAAGVGEAVNHQLPSGLSLTEINKVRLHKAPRSLHWLHQTGWRISSTLTGLAEHESCISSCLLDLMCHGSWSDSHFVLFFAAISHQLDGRYLIQM